MSKPNQSESLFSLSFVSLAARVQGPTEERATEVIEVSPMAVEVDGHGYIRFEDFPSFEAYAMWCRFHT